METDKIIWKNKTMRCIFDPERAAWISMQSPLDPDSAEFLLTPDEFPQLDGDGSRWLGNLVLEIVTPKGKTILLSTSDLQVNHRISKTRDGFQSQCCFRENAEISVSETYYMTDQGLKWNISLRNESDEKLIIRRAGIPLLMNQYFRKNDAFKYEQCMLRHSCICHQNSWIYWEKPNGSSPLLILKTMGETALDCFSVEKTGRFGAKSTLGEAFEGCFTAYMIHEKTEHFPDCSGIRQLLPGETISWNFLMGMVQSPENAQIWLAENGGFYLKSVPGMVMPYGIEGTAMINSIEKPVVEPVCQETEAGIVSGEPGRWEVSVRLKCYGRARLRIRVNGMVSFLTFFGIEPPEDIYRGQSAFISENQWETNEADPCFHGLLMWDMVAKSRINAFCNPHGPDWFAGGSDEIGLASGLFLSEWNVYRPSEKQIRILCAYCKDFIEERLTEQPGYRIHRMVPWYQMFDDWKGNGADDVWRAYNYVHVVNTYYNMYRIASEYQYTWMDEPVEWLQKAYEYMMAMFRYWMFPEGKGATEIANMGESVLVIQLSEALLKYGLSEEVKQLSELIDKKADFITQKEYPYGSEMAYDTTAFEAVYAYGKIKKERKVMEQTVGVAFANRGWQPVWYLYMTDLRQMGESSWNVSYMTQLGAWSMYDWAFMEEERTDYDWLESVYASYLAGFSIYNSGGGIGVKMR